VIHGVSVLCHGLIHSLCDRFSHGRLDGVEQEVGLAGIEEDAIALIVGDNILSQPPRSKPVAISVALTLRMQDPCPIEESSVWLITHLCGEGVLSTEE
jgi:hypothetical protein